MGSGSVTMLVPITNNKRKRKRKEKEKERKERRKERKQLGSLTVKVVAKWRQCGSCPPQSREQGPGAHTDHLPSRLGRIWRRLVNFCRSRSRKAARLPRKIERCGNYLRTCCKFPGFLRILWRIQNLFFTSKLTNFGV